MHANTVESSRSASGVRVNHAHSEEGHTTCFDGSSAADGSSVWTSCSVSELQEASLLSHAVEWGKTSASTGDEKSSFKNI